MRLDQARWPSPVPIAHRGSRLLWPENTLRAFSGALELGYRHLETDLHLTADGVLVCIHDHTVDRTTDGTGEVASFTLTELKALDAGYRHAGDGGFPFRGQGIDVPTFEEVVTAFPEAHFVVDLKVDGLAAPLAELVERLGLHERLLVGAFSDERLDEFRRLTGGEVATSTGPLLSRLWVLTSRVGRGGGGEAQALQLPTQLRGVRVVDEKLVKAAHDAGLQVHVWTVNRKEEMIRLLALGVDGLVTDRPDLLKTLLVERGEWRWG
jgi:glycerophosphoryl diester phosphodiesterase